MPTEPTIFRVSNHHTPSCGRPPSVDNDAPGTYHGYFENRYGEQSLFIYDRSKGEGLLHCGDAGWERPFRVVDGRPEDLVLSPEPSECFALGRVPAGVARELLDGGSILIDRGEGEVGLGSGGGAGALDMIRIPDPGYPAGKESTSPSTRVQFLARHRSRIPSRRERR